MFCGPAGGRGRLPSPADDNHQGFASVNRAPEPAGGAYPRLGFQHRPCQRERGTGRSGTAGCGVAPVGLKSVGGRSRRSRSPGGAGAAPGASNRGEGGSAAGHHQPRTAPGRRPGLGPAGPPQQRSGRAGNTSGAERRAALSPGAGVSAFPWGRGSACNGDTFPLDVCAANGRRKLCPLPGVSPGARPSQPLSCLLIPPEIKSLSPPTSPGSFPSLCFLFSFKSVLEFWLE